MSRPPLTVWRDPPAATVTTFLAGDPLYGAYALGYLEPPWRRHARFWLALEEEGPVALAVTYTETAPPLLLAFGSRHGVTAVLAETEMTRWRVHLREQGQEVWLAGHGEALEALSGFFYLLETRSLQRQVLDAPVRQREDQGPAAVPTSSDQCPRRLDPDDAVLLNRLYELHDDDPFSIEELTRGAYYGLVTTGPDDQPGCIAVAGTHVVAPEHSIAAVGNVYTAPAHRGHGHATVCLDALCTHYLEQGYQHIVLNVDHANQPALTIYRRLGFHPHCCYEEIRAIAL